MAPDGGGYDGRRHIYESTTISGSSRAHLGDVLWYAPDDFFDRNRNVQSTQCEECQRQSRDHGHSYGPSTIQDSSVIMGNVYYNGNIYLASQPDSMRTRSVSYAQA